MQELFNTESAHLNKMYWWMGQVVDESCWQDNSNKKIHDRDDVEGWGKRYKVRIFGRDTKVKDVPDDQLEMADIVYPVTAGSGHGGSYQTPNIRQGTYVVGFYKDGINATEPIILGCLGNNSQTRLFGGDPEEGYIPRDGFFGVEKKPVSNKDQYIKPGSEFTNNSKQDQNTNTKDLHVQQADGAIYDVVLKTIECDGPGGELKGIQGAIEKTLATIARIKLAANSHLDAAKSITASISSIVDSAIGFVTGLVKKIVEKMRGYVLNKINNGIKDVATMLFPNQRWDFAKAAEQANDTLGCVFNKIIAGLLKLVTNLFKDLVNKYINAPMCAAEQFVGNIVSNILGDVADGINGVLNTINGLINTVGNIASKVFQILDFVSGLLKFLKCESTPSCEYKDRWSIWNGSKTAENVSANLDKIMKDIDNAGGGGGGGSPPPCNTSQLPCGPPGIRITGGGGSGAAANAVIGIAGEIMALDFSSLGSGYNSTPSIEIDDQCNSGGGAQISLLTTSGGGQSTTKYQKAGEGQNNVKVVGAVVDPNNSGAGYLRYPNGKTGGPGYPISNEDDVIIIRPVIEPLPDVDIILPAVNRQPPGEEPVIRITEPLPPTWEVVPPGRPVLVTPGDEVYLKKDVVVEIYDNDGNLSEVITGGGPSTPVTVEVGGTFTTPLTNKEINTEYSTVINIGDNRTIPELLTRIINQNVGTFELIDILRDVNPPIFIENGDAISAADLKDILDQKTQVTLKIGDKTKTLVPDASPLPKYDVIVLLDDVIINNPGIGYSKDDTIFVTPDTGVELIPTFNDLGSLTDVKIVSRGSSFNTMPKIVVQSRTGVNADIWPVFKVIKVEDEDQITQGQSILSVVDCVGKYSIPR